VQGQEQQQEQEQEQQQLHVVEARFATAPSLCADIRTPSLRADADDCVWELCLRRIRRECKRRSSG
jgi:hypothetical protein